MNDIRIFLLATLTATLLSGCGDVINNYTTINDCCCDGGVTDDMNASQADGGVTDDMNASQADASVIIDGGIAADMNATNDSGSVSIDAAIADFGAADGGIAIDAGAIDM